MFNVVKAELRKLRRPTLFFGTMGAALFFTGLITSFIYLMIDSPQGNGDRGRTIGREVLGLANGSVNGFASVGGFLGIIALCVFAAQTAQEYTYGTLRNLLIRQPSRMKILIGKLISMALFAIAMITIAPELPGASVAITHLTAAGVTVALGHTDGDFADAASGTNAGGRVITHFMNAMDKGLNETSFASFVIADERLTVELILDGHHVPYKTAQEIYAAVGNRLIFVTDAMAAAGGTDGNYTIGELPVIVKDGVARLESNGSLAGSTLTMDAIFRNSIQELGLSIPEAVAATSTRAAKLMGLTNRGEIAVGNRADLLSYNENTQSITLINS
mgnify:CR=1 FL=1